MKATEYIVDNKKVSYLIEEDKGGYSIFLNGELWITQYPPNIPFPELSLEEGCLKQIKDIVDSFAAATTNNAIETDDTIDVTPAE